MLTGVPHSLAETRLADKAWGADHLCPQGAHEPHPGESIGSMMAVTVPREDERHLYSSEREQTNSTSLLKEFSAVLAEKGSPGLPKTHEPMVVDLRPGATPVRQRLYA